MTNIYEQLPPDTLEQELLIRKQKLEELISLKKKVLQEAPQGKLRISKNKGTIQYYLVSEKQTLPSKTSINKNHSQKYNSNNGTYISKAKMDAIKSLAQKDYNSKVLPILQEQLDAINSALEKLKKNDICELYNSFSEQRKSLLEPVTLPPEEYISRWQKTEYPQKTFAPDAPEFFTAKGERVRSKSEIIIADTLNRHSIPYHYEFPLQLENFTAHPDFICINPKTRQEFIWEHFGLMDDLDYSNAAVKKIKAYQNAGYFPGDNFILTMETAESPINSKQIEQIIEKYLK